ncbi:hypothetical protein BU24DRAFT_452288 [Aaosphaeria arxii CBS 175.79]|uniref:Uncharacterized protein n=1 Tax=Aaosphaeria arxii CBS 175.79 TaxID=1450172 RepID=A0A6A5XK94_9PLEO|nr:uncharacterized protein BU24DRAFT_452288 [Aaosphaeria arxii CBS 175.79]KAF2013373.1 hypothetical protein BU24DRAFT_452288 [Aaosphaeria arxii CBS 175.79]
MGVMVMFKLVRPSVYVVIYFFLSQRRRRQRPAKLTLRGHDDGTEVVMAVARKAPSSELCVEPPRSELLYHPSIDRLSRAACLSIRLLECGTRAERRGGEGRDNTHTPRTYPWDEGVTAHAARSSLKTVLARSLARSRGARALRPSGGMSTTGATGPAGGGLAHV